MASLKNVPQPKTDSLDEWLAALAKPTVLTELAVLIACALLAWLVVRLVRHASGNADKKSILFGRRDIDGVLFPLLLLGLAYSARAVLMQAMPLENP